MTRTPNPLLAAGLLAWMMAAGCALPGYDYSGGGGSASGGRSAAGGTGAMGGSGGAGAMGTGASGAVGAGTGTGGGGGVGPYLGDCPAGPTLPASSALFDDFADGTVSAGKWHVEGNASFDNQQLVLSPTSVDRWAAVSSILDVSLASCAIQAEVLAVLGGSFDDTSLSFMGLQDEELALYAQGSVLMVFVRPEAGAPALEIPLANLDLDVHRYWRIEESANRIRFQTSADGKQWDTAHIVDPTPAWVSAGYVRISTWMNADSSSPARFDDVNEPPL